MCGMVCLVDVMCVWVVVYWLMIWFGVLMLVCGFVLMLFFGFLGFV